MATFTKPQVLNFLESKAAEALRGAATPAEASTRFILLKFIKICVENDIITVAQINAGFPEFP